MTTKQFADRHGRRIGGAEKFRRFGDTRANVKTDGANQQAEHIRDAPSPIDQLLVREQRRQGERPKSETMTEVIPVLAHCQLAL